MYNDLYSEEITKKLSKLKKKDLAHYNIVSKKIEQILINPEHKYKELHYDMKGINRVHIGHFVLVFQYNPTLDMINFDDFDHHDKIFGK